MSTIGEFPSTSYPGALPATPGIEDELTAETERWRRAWRLLDQQRADLDAQRIRLRSQRRRVGLSLKQQRAELRAQLEEFHAALTDNVAAAGGSTAELAELRRERDELRQRLAAVPQERSAEEQQAEEQKMYELRRRFEMAVEDMRAYKQRAEELEEQLAQRPKAVAPVAAATGGPLDWAQQKAKMLASLETDMGGADEKTVNDRLTVEGAVRITDEVVAEKEREIQQLNQQLEELRAERVSRAGQDREAVALLDHDSLIASERERLRKLQESAIEKQRAAEVEFAVERAKLARQRVEMEDRMHAMQSDLSHRQACAGSREENSASAKPARGRWLARLGLKDGD